MQVTLNTAFEIVLYIGTAYIFIGFLFTLFPQSLLSTPQSLLPTPSFPDSPVPCPQYATLDWVVKATDNEPVESVNVIALAIPRMKAVDLKQLARSRRIKGYGSMRKSQLIEVMI